MKYFFYTQGCKVNQVETENLKFEVIAKKRKLCDHIEDSDCIVINSCAVTDNAVKKTRNILKKLKKQFPDKKIVLTGCAAEMFRDNPPEESDMIVTNAGKSNVLDFIEKGEDFKDSIDNVQHFEEFNENLVKDKTRGFLKIQDGCDAFCSYCIIPSLRGRPRSSLMENVLFKFKNFIDNGYKEIVLVGIHIGKYGVDTGSSLKELLKNISRFQGDFRVRLSSLEVNEIDDEFIRIMQDSNVFCHHFHIPLQSGSDKILKLMNRHYNKHDFIKTVQKLKKIFPDANIGGDVITGFPGETDVEFKETEDTIYDAGMNYLHVFPYSERKNTSAVNFKDTVPVAERSRRAKFLREVSDSLKFNFAKKYFGKELRILTEMKNAGLTDNYLSVKFLNDVDKNLFVNGKVVSVSFDGEVIVTRCYE